MPVLLGLSLFTVLLAVVAGVRRGLVSEAKRFVVEGWGAGWLRRGVWSEVRRAVIVTVVHDEFRGMGLSGVSGFLGAGAVVVDVVGDVW